MSSQPRRSSFQKLIHLLNHCKQEQLTHKVIVQSESDKTTWYIYVCLGRLVWTDGGIHPNRTWNRLTSKFCPQVNWNELKIDSFDRFESKDYSVLNFLIQEQLIATERATELIKTKAAETLFDLLQLETTSTFKVLSEKIPTSSFLVSAATRSSFFVDVESVFNETQQSWQNWRQQELTSFSPNLAPKIEKQEELREAVPENVYQNFVKLLNGQTTLRELSFRLDKDISKLTAFLIPYIRSGSINFLTIKDISYPKYVPRPNNTDNVQKANVPLIVCVDDSPQICRIMEQIVTNCGYRFIGIQNSLQVVPTLIKSDPALIFLDIGMPVINGYEICSQIKRVSKLKDIPIIILTGNDGIVDRVRAKVVGANDFINKPVEISKIIGAIQKNLESSLTSSSQVT